MIRVDGQQLQGHMNDAVPSKFKDSLDVMLDPKADQLRRARRSDAAQ